MSELEKAESSVPRANVTHAAPARVPKLAVKAWARELSGHARRVPKWAWLSGGALAFVLTATLLYLALRPAPGWTLVVQGAPAGSDVFVDNVRRGITSADGTVRVLQLRAGNKVLEVSSGGQRDSQTVSGSDGETKEVYAKLTPALAANTLPGEIEYEGRMALIPAGEFVMGADDGGENERPAHKVTLPAYYIDKYEVTNAQFKKFCEATGHPLPLNPYWTQDVLGTDDYLNKFPEHPVIGVSWDDANAYARWAGKRLPTEEEWEKAASWGRDAQSKRRWPWGDTFITGRANVTRRPARVMDFAGGASAYGVFNMAGNVSEWVNDHYLPYPNNQGDGVIGDKNYSARYGTDYRVTRGGTFSGDEQTVRTSRRDAKPPDSRTKPGDAEKRRSLLIGFRCAVSADDPRLQQVLGAGGQ